MTGINKIDGSIAPSKPSQPKPLTADQKHAAIQADKKASAAIPATTKPEVKKAPPATAEPPKQPDPPVGRGDTPAGGGTKTPGTPSNQASKTPERVETARDLVNAYDKQQSTTRAAENAANTAQLVKDTGDAFSTHPVVEFLQIGEQAGEKADRLRTEAGQHRNQLGKLGNEIDELLATSTPQSFFGLTYGEYVRLLQIAEGDKEGPKDTSTPPPTNHAQVIQDASALAAQATALANTPTSGARGSIEWKMDQVERQQLNTAIEQVLEDPSVIVGLHPEAFYTLADYAFEYEQSQLTEKSLPYVQSNHDR